jgi:uracil-DNA glycosylase
MECFTDAVIQKIQRGSMLCFLLWGGFAHKKGLKIDQKQTFGFRIGTSFAINQGKWFGISILVKQMCT